jgi:hypothetical protein
MASFIPPSGFEKETREGVVIFTKNSPDRSSFCIIAVYGSRPGTGDLQKEFQLEWDDLIRKTKHTEAPAERQIERGDNGWSVISGRSIINLTPAYASLLVTYVGHGKVFSVLVNINADQFMPEATQFMKSLEIVSTPAASGTPSGAAVKSSGIAGMWRSACGDGTSVSGITNAAGTAYSSFSTTTGKLRVKHILFFPDGTFCNYVLGGGYLNYSEQRAGDPNIWGTYQLNGSSGQIKFDGLTTPDFFSVQNGKIMYGKCVFERLPWVEGLRLNATYSVETNPDAYRANGMNAEPVIRFSSDGRFSDTGAVYYLNHIRQTSSDYSDNKYGEGRYELKSFTLSLYFDDGRNYHYTYMNFDGNVYNPPQIGVAMNFLSRK